MADDTSKLDKSDRHQAAGGEDYETQYLARRTGITPAQARDLIDRFGNDMQLLIQEAKKLA